MAILGKPVRDRRCRQPLAQHDVLLTHAQYDVLPTHEGKDSAEDKADFFGLTTVPLMSIQDFLGLLETSRLSTVCQGWRRAIDTASNW